MFGRERILGAAYDCLLEQKWNALPVNPSLFRLPFVILSYQDYADLANIPVDRLISDPALAEGCTVAGLHGKTLLFYNAQSPPPRQRFTVAHELGHLLLRHSERGHQEENEADSFASMLLMPDALLAVLRRKGLCLTEAFLVRTFGVSRGAARRKLTESTCFSIPHPSDALIKAQFSPELARLLPYQEPDAGFEALHDRYLHRFKG